MCIFNDLSGGNSYPSLLVHFDNGRERVIKNVVYFAVHGDSLRVVKNNCKKDTVLENVRFATVTHYKYRIVKGKAKPC